jgi:hypothetical protein
MNTWNIFIQYDHSLQFADDFGNLIKLPPNAHVCSYEFLAAA